MKRGYDGGLTDRGRGAELYAMLVTNEDRGRVERGTASRVFDNQE